MPTPPDTRQNHLLAALPADEYACLCPHLELVPMPLGDVLYESGIQMRQVHFPTTSIVSTFEMMATTATTAVADFNRSNAVSNDE
jgi:hypothetical protein